MSAVVPEKKRAMLRDVKFPYEIRELAESAFRTRGNEGSGHIHGGLQQGRVLRTSAMRKSESSRNDTTPTLTLNPDLISHACSSKSNTEI